tara:strand:+ start:683 stop:1096 length:414 start_codon:yes stop_codon:yes gene_type:complete
MNKFLKLVEENRPGQDKYTIELRDSNGKVVDSFDMFGVSSPFDIFDSFKREYAPDGSVEDQEVAMGSNKPYDVEKEVNKLANQAKGGVMGKIAGAMGTAPQEAKKAVKMRADLAKKAVDLYNQQTGKLSNAIDAAKG